MFKYANMGRIVYLTKNLTNTNPFLLAMYKLHNKLCMMTMITTKELNMEVKRCGLVEHFNYVQ